MRSIRIAEVLQRNHGIAVDRAHHRAFLSCEINELITVFDLDRHVPIVSLPLGGGPDVIKFDPGLGCIYLACYSGGISVFEQQDADHYKEIARIATVKWLRTSYLSPGLAAYISLLGARALRRR